MRSRYSIFDTDKEMRRCNDPMVRAGTRDGIHRLQRYTLVRLDGALKTLENQWARRVGTAELRPTGKQLRGAVPAREVDLVHNDLQNALFELLVSKFGEDAVKMEERFADIRLRRGGTVTLIEVKSDSRPRFAMDKPGTAMPGPFVKGFTREARRALRIFSVRSVRILSYSFRLALRSIALTFTTLGRDSCDKPTTGSRFLRPI